ncbi:F0F1 ATP synthase subunit A [Candidatus Gracilibacteria bacterium]|nr:F0F1 ATP synthase subunit A [Candidatus Gracilibacteria bacterium]
MFDIENFFSIFDWRLKNKTLKDMQELIAFIEGIIPFLKSGFAWQPAFTGLVAELFILGILYFLYKKFPKSGFFVMFEQFFEKSYEFFEDILGKDEKKWIKMYIVIMFFIILLSNLLGVFLEFLIPIFGHHMEEFIKIPTADINFNIAMAVVGVVIVIIEQFKALGFWKAIHEYVPIKGKDLIPYERGNLPFAVDWFVYIIVKFFDIAISLFLGVLEIVGHAAKVISLSFRLFGNMTSGGILLAMLFGAIIGLTQNLFSIDFPVIGPIILYLQELLVAVIQALVFPLLIAIFIKVAKVH